MKPTLSIQRREIEHLIKPPEPPERIFGWLNSQFSIAHHYGGMTYKGHDYKIAYLEEGQPLIRVDVLNREVKEQNARKKAERAAMKSYAELAQVGLL
jgi:hypothetical protein